MSAKASKQFVDFRAVKAAVTMEQVLQYYNLLGSLKGNSDRLSGCCPLHKGTNSDQFRVCLSKNVWHCFGNCGHGGNTLDFVAEMEAVPVREAALLLTQWFGLLPSPPASRQRVREEKEQVPVANAAEPVAPENTEPVSESGTPSADPADEGPNPALSFELQHLDPGHSYLAERGLQSDTIEGFGLGYCGKGLMRGRVVIPIHNLAGELVAYAGRWPGEPQEDKSRYSLPKNFRKSLELFNAHRVRELIEVADDPFGPLLVVEGFFDCMKLVQAGYHRTVALMGSSLSAQQETLIGELLNESAAIVLLLDEDDAGRRARAEIASRLALRYFVRVIALPEVGMQPDALSREQLGGILESALADTPLLNNSNRRTTNGCYCQHQ